MPKLSHSVSGAFQTFSYWIANRSVGQPILDGIDYSCVFEEPSALEQAYAIFANVLEFDEEGTVLNAKEAERRAAQHIRSYVDRAYKKGRSSALLSPARGLGWQIARNDLPPATAAVLCRIPAAETCDSDDARSVHLAGRDGSARKQLL